ncbi:hypothetical protein [Nocardia sp. NBC_01377]|uniref:hypothetical protein n=1 Tax=Nocardia sp. NBC_01377 TaxID=2903595 RepID=UPI003866278F
MVLDEVWRRLDGVEPLSGPSGGPLRRTVKLVLDPLVIRPVQNPDCAGPILSEDGATLLATRIHASADVLRATAAWFTLLKQVRRTLRITEGHPQDLYFQRCFELATTKAMPDAARDRAAAEETLRDIHEFSAGRTTQALKQHVTEESKARELVGLIELAWRRRPATASPADHDAELSELLDAAAQARWEGDGDAGQRSLDRLVDAHAGTHSGLSLWQRESGSSAREFGLTEHPLPPRPALGASASTSKLALPFDRTVYERVFTVLQASSERAELPPIPELVTNEIARSCAPWALLDESLRVTAAAGGVLATGLAPIDSAQPLGPRRVAVVSDIADHPSGRIARRSRTEAVVPSGPGALPGSSPPDAESAGRESPQDRTMHGSRSSGGGFGSEHNETAAQRAINSRWQREAYVLQARRLTLDTTATLASDNPLAVIAAELRTPWRPYLRRLWVRLHGRDVREAGVFEPDELWDLLDGVARSVILDHRTRVKNALSALTLAMDPDETESRAS